MISICPWSISEYTLCDYHFLHRLFFASISRLESQNQTESVKLNWTEKISMLLSDYDKKLVEAAAVGIDVTNITQHRQNVSTQAQDWNFWNSLLFAGTVYTTIGRFV